MPITRRRTIDDDDDDFDERGLLKDGRRLRVPLTMMDSANQQALAERYPLRSARSAPGGRRQCSEQDIVDAAQPPIGRSIPSLAALLDATSPEHDVLMQRRAEADEAYRDSIRELSNAWRGRNASDEDTVSPWAPDDPKEDGRKRRALQYYGGETAPSTASNRDPTGENTFGSRPDWRGAKPGDVCTIDGRRGRLNERLECVPDERLDSMDARDAALQKCHVPTVSLADSNRIRAQAYADMCRELRDAWRN